MRIVCKKGTLQRYYMHKHSTRLSPIFHGCEINFLSHSCFEYFIERHRIFDWFENDGERLNEVRNN
jgi:hypothetical protein